MGREETMSFSRLTHLADEVVFVFGEPLNVTDDLHYNKQELIVSEKLMAYWTNFGKFRYWTELSTTTTTKGERSVCVNELHSLFP
jgi:hypothetical protein